MSRASPPGRPSAGTLGPAYAGTALLDLARQFLSHGPADPVALIGHVCALPSPPRAVAEHMAVAMLSRDPGFQHLADGRWQLAEREVPLARAREVRGEPLAGLTWVVVDVETTGTGLRRGDRLTEWAAVTVRNGKVAEAAESLVNPERAIPYHVSRLTNITGDMVARAPRFAEVCARVVEVLRSGVFVAHNATFDWHFLSQEVLRAGGGKLAGRRLCTLRLARAVLPQLPRRSLDALTAYFGVENHARHRAGGDALATAKVLTRLLDLAGERDCHTWSDLQALMRRTPRKRPRRQRLPRSIEVDPTL